MGHKTTSDEGAPCNQICPCQAASIDRRHGHSLYWWWTSTMVHQTVRWRILQSGLRWQDWTQPWWSLMSPNGARPQSGRQEGASRFGLSRDQLFNKQQWSVDEGIDYFNCDADVIVMLVAQNFLTVKMAGWSFGRKQNYGLTVTVSSEEWWHMHKFNRISANHGILGIARKLLMRRAKLLHLVKVNL